MIAAYTLTVSLIYMALWIISESAAEALTIAFVALLLIPSCIHEVRRERRHHGR